MLSRIIIYSVLALLIAGTGYFSQNIAYAGDRMSIGDTEPVVCAKQKVHQEANMFSIHFDGTCIKEFLSVYGLPVYYLKGTGFIWFQYP